MLMRKIAVVLFNLGGPDSQDSIYPFLVNFFSDANIIRIPAPLRFALARLVAYRRSRREAGTSYGLLGGKSPLLENTRKQAEALQKSLHDMKKGYEFKTFIAMRYWHPLSSETAARVKDFAPDEIVLLPLYPQYSTTTTRSSLQAWRKSCLRLGLDVPTSMVCCYPQGSGFIEASAVLVKDAYEKAVSELSVKNLPAPRVLFSAHGLPEQVIADGDPYQWQCEQGAAAIAEATGIASLDWQICYQSRVGPLKWIGPGTEEALRQAARDKVPVLIYPHAFVSEHVETLVEIEQEYRETARRLGIPWFGRVETVGTAAPFIEGLARSVLSTLGSEKIAPDGQARICPSEFSRCCLSEFGKEICHARPAA
jgi:ferrochelatase